MKSNAQDTELKAALAEFENSLATPIVSGELADWVEQLGEAWNEASAQMHYAIKHAHPRVFDEIGAEDAELLPKVEVLKAEDDGIEAEREHIGRMVARDAAHVPKFEPDEAKAQKHVQNLINEGMAFVMRVRKQEVAIETWLVEAFNRDRGAGD